MKQSGWRWTSGLGGAALYALGVTTGAAAVERRADLAPDQVEIELQRPLLKADGSVVVPAGPHRARFRYDPGSECATLALDDNDDADNKPVLGVSAEAAPAAKRSPGRDNTELAVRRLASKDVCRSGTGEGESAAQTSSEPGLRVGEVRAIATEAHPALEAMLSGGVAGQGGEPGTAAGASGTLEGGTVLGVSSGSLGGVILGVALIMAEGDESSTTVSTAAP